MDACRETGPGEDKLADGRQDGADAHDAGAGLWGDAACFRVLGMRVDDPAPDRLEADGDHGPYTDPDERQARHAWSPAALVLEHDGISHEALHKVVRTAITQEVINGSEEGRLTKYRIPYMTLILLKASAQRAYTYIHLPITQAPKRTGSYQRLKNQRIGSFKESTNGRLKLTFINWAVDFLESY